MIQQVDKRHRLLKPNELQIGSWVMLRVPPEERKRAGKRSPEYTGRYKIVDRVPHSGNLIIVELLNGGQELRRQVPPDQLKPVEITDDADPEQTFAVERILAHRKVGNAMHYRVLWQGYPMSDASWEPEESFMDTGVIDRYWEWKEEQRSTKSKRK